MSTAHDVRAALAAVADPADAQHLQRFFKTKPGEYGEGDVFLGVRVPATRAITKRFDDLSLDEVDGLLDDAVHEARLAGALILVLQSQRARRAGDEAAQRAIVDRYLGAMARGRINNWDLVDASAEHVIGEYLWSRPRDLLVRLAGSTDVWERRIAIMSTFALIKHGESATTLEIALLLLRDDHDLIHKAVGWMLREVGKRVDRADLLAFLDAHAAAMPRTMLAYAVEHLEASLRAHYRALR